MDDIGCDDLECVGLVEVFFGLLHSLCRDTDLRNRSTESLKLDLTVHFVGIIVLHLTHGTLLVVLDNKYFCKHFV